MVLNTSKSIEGFDTPDAFIFVYEKEMFISLKDGKINYWQTNGELITDFGQEELYTMKNKDQPESDRNYVISLSNSRKFLFSFVKSNMRKEVEDAEDDDVWINVMEIQGGEKIAEVRPF